jgi:hypothetical protein
MACGQVVGSLGDRRLTHRYAVWIRRLELDAAASPLAGVPECLKGTPHCNCTDNDNADDNTNEEHQR